MIQLKTTQDIEGIQKSARISVAAFQALAQAIRPGVTTKHLDTIAEEVIRSHNGRPAFLGYDGFPGSICISINEEVIHGIPGNRVIQDHDMVGIDLGVELEGYFSDCARTFLMPEVTKVAKQLADVTEKCLHLAIEQCYPGKRIRDISKAVSAEAKHYGYGIVEEYCGHGVGFALHEEPSVPNYRSRDRDASIRLREGMVLAIEPMINIGTHLVDHLEDEWTVITQDGSLSAHFEHTVAVTAGGPLVLTQGR